MNDQYTILWLNFIHSVQREARYLNVFKKKTTKENKVVARIKKHSELNGNNHS